MVSIDRVYQTVLTILNKEGMGYITPQEFNLYANQAQIEIFERYFADDYRDNSKPKVASMYTSDAVTEKLAIFNREDQLAETGAGTSIWKFEAMGGELTLDGGVSSPIAASTSNYYIIDGLPDEAANSSIKLFNSIGDVEDLFNGDYEVFLRDGVRMVYSTTDLEGKHAYVVTSDPEAARPEAYKLISLFSEGLNINEVDRTSVSYMLRSPLTTPSMSQPVFHRVNDSDAVLGDVKVYPREINSVTAYYIRKPIDVAWELSTDDRVDFELHGSEFPELVVKTLSYAGVTVKRQDITQLATQAEQAIIQSNQ